MSLEDDYYAALAGAYNHSDEWDEYWREIEADAAAGVVAEINAGFVPGIPDAEVWARVDAKYKGAPHHQQDLAQKVAEVQIARNKKGGSSASIGDLALDTIAKKVVERLRSK